MWNVIIPGLNNVASHVALICGVTKKPCSQAVGNPAYFRIFLQTEGPSLCKRGNHYKSNDYVVEFKHVEVLTGLAIGALTS